MNRQKEDIQRLVLVDGSSYLYRAFFAIQGLQTSKGVPTNAIYGVVRMILKVFSDIDPHYLAVVFDLPEPTFRHKIFPEYKSHRPPTPDALVSQIKPIKEVIKAFNWPMVELSGYEADDIIATLTHRAKDEGAEVIIISGDKDLLSLVGPGVTMVDTLKDIRYDPKGVTDKMGVPPGRVTDVLALMGDKTDNIPGVPGIGVKTAVSLVSKFGSLDEIYGRLEEVNPPRIRELLRQNRDEAFLSKKLVTLRDDLPVSISWDELVIGKRDHPRLLELFKEFEFYSLIRELTPADQTAGQRGRYVTLTAGREIKGVIDAARKKGRVSIDTETTAKDPMRAELVGISLAYQKGEGFYIPIAHAGGGGQASLSTVREILGPLLADPKVAKIGQNLKYDLIVLNRHGLPLEGLSFDTMVAAYLLAPGSRTYKLDDLALRYLGYRMISYKEVAKEKKDFSQVSIDEATEYAAEDADIALRLADLLEPALEEKELSDLFETIEMPLVEVLADMEMAGVKVDTDRLQKFSRDLAGKLAEKETKIFAIAGEEFTINSPKQLSRILFEKIGLPVIKKTKTGYSTGEDVLQQLAALHPLPAEIIEYRQMSKLKSTYLDPLPTMVNPETGRIHTSFNQTQTATGRLSSSDPNLQNIPVRTSMGTEIRRTFIAEKGNLLVSADYSQIELRILAHLSGDPTLRKAFQFGEDIHAATAAEIFDVPPEKVTSKMRREAKVVNFGIIYGMSAFGLSRELGIDPKEAQEYIDRYMDRYPKVRDYIEEMVETATSKGYATTLQGRRRSLPELASDDHNQRQLGRRLAINTPIQGTAADMIKTAMIRLYHRLKKVSSDSRMILQIHDELLCEAPGAEVEKVEAAMKKEMEEVVKLSIPVVVTVNHGPTWAEAHD